MKTTRWQVTCLILGLVFIGGGVAAEPQPQKAATGAKQEMKQHKMHGRMMHHMQGYAGVVIKQAEALGLTDKQLGKIVRIQMAEKKRRKEFMGKLHKSMKTALSGLRNPAVDEEAIRKAGTAHAADFEALIDAALQAREKINAVLTPEQRTKLKAMKPAMSGKEAGNRMGGADS